MPRWVIIAALMAVVPAGATPSHAGSANKLHHAARTGDGGKISDLLNSGVEVDATNGDGETALYVAAKTGKANVVQSLLKAGANPLLTAKGPFGSLGTALHVAAKFGRLEVVRILLDAGIDPNLPDAGAGPPLHQALSRNRKDVAELLMSRGAGSVPAAPVDHLIAGSDIALGEKISGTCKACHDLTAAGAKKVGPPLWDVVGRKKASFPGFEYSQAILNKGGEWTYADLNSLMADPRAFIPGTKMSALSGIAAPERRAALLLYLRSLSDAPKPLP